MDAVHGKSVMHLLGMHLCVFYFFIPLLILAILFSNRPNMQVSYHQRTSVKRYLSAFRERMFNQQIEKHPFSIHYAAQKVHLGVMFLYRIWNKLQKASTDWIWKEKHKYDNPNKTQYTIKTKVWKPEIAI